MNTKKDREKQWDIVGDMQRMKDGRVDRVDTKRDIRVDRVDTKRDNRVDIDKHKERNNRGRVGRQ